jgi:hypothetical protein
MQANPNEDALYLEAMEQLVVLNDTSSKFGGGAARSEHRFGAERLWVDLFAAGETSG